jgi:hypothetical protein
MEYTMGEEQQFLWNPTIADRFDADAEVAMLTKLKR